MTIRRNIYGIGCDTFGTMWCSWQWFNSRAEAQKVLLNCAEEFATECYPVDSRVGLVRIKGPAQPAVDFERRLYVEAAKYSMEHGVRHDSYCAYLPYRVVKKRVAAEFFIRERGVTCRLFKSQRTTEMVRSSNGHQDTPRLGKRFRIG